MKRSVCGAMNIIKLIPAHLVWNSIEGFNWNSIQQNLAHYFPNYSDANFIIGACGVERHGAASIALAASTFKLDKDECSAVHAALGSGARRPGCSREKLADHCLHGWTTLIPTVYACRSLSAQPQNLFLR